MGVIQPNEDSRGVCGLILENLPEVSRHRDVFLLKEKHFLLVVVLVFVLEDPASPGVDLYLPP